MAERKSMADALPDDDGPVEPGYCVGHYDANDGSCRKCDIQDTCRDVTADMESSLDEDEEERQDAKKEHEEK